MKTCHSHITPFALHLRKIEIHFISREINNILGITFSRRNVHFSHLLVHLRNYHANAPSITSLECHFLY